MILYHGSNVKVDNPKLLPTKRFLDFGKGFYLTSDFEQASKWAARTTKSRNEGKPTVSVFTTNEVDFKYLNCLLFKAPDKDWLRYIAANRTGKELLDEFDLVIGPVANDQAIRTINQYLKGYYPEHIAIELLLPQKLKDQYAFKTEKALELLHFKEAVTL